MRNMSKKLRYGTQRFVVYGVQAEMVVALHVRARLPIEDFNTKSLQNSFIFSIIKTTIQWIEEKLERKVRYKKIGVWIVGLSWTMLSGIIFYLCYRTINDFGLYTILSLITFVTHIIVGFALKTPRLLVRNAFLYPFGTIVAQILNEISLRWNYSIETTITDFGVSNWIILLCFHVPPSLLAFVLLRFMTGYEVVPPNPISSYSYYLKSSEENPIQLLKSYISLFENASPKIFREKELTWLTFWIDPNDYAIAFIPKNKNEYEVNLLAYRLRSDTLCEADKDEADTAVSIINALFVTWKEQELIDEWQIENAPKRSEEMKETFVKEYISGTRTPFGIPSLGEAKHDLVDWVKRNKNQIASIIITAIISPLILYFLTSFLEF